MMKKAATLGVLLALLGSNIRADEGPVPKGIPHLDHVFVIMMENHAYAQIVNNPNAPFANRYAASANTGTNYFAVAHPSLTNYLEVNGGSNFGVLNDNSPDWHDATCTTNIASGTASLDNGMFPNICPIYGTGMDAATPVIDYTNETSGPPGVIEVDGVVSYPAASTIGMTIGDQLVSAGLSWKSYQESLGPGGADGINLSDGFFNNTSDLTTALPGETTSLIGLYAVKHNPFAYFQSVQQGNDPHNSLNNIVDFSGPNGLYADLASGRVPSYSWIVPNQCDDQHGRGNAGPECEYDPNDNGTQVGLNPGLIATGDASLETIVNAIHHSPAWYEGRAAIVVIWDENDYSISPTTNQVLLIVDTNYSRHGVSSSKFYTHFSLLKSIEAGFRLPCLNHACDSSTAVMSDLFGRDLF
jgi:hypothetical protein